MRFLIISLFCLLLTLPSYAQEESMLICDRGVQKCVPLKNNVDTYAQCLKLMCLHAKDVRVMPKTNQYGRYEGYNPVEQQTCDTGLRRCNPLRKEPTYYWECMHDTCTNPDLRDRDLMCPAGEATCSSDYSTYEFCVKATCRAKKEEGMCETGRNSCKTSLNAYWQCMSNVCLGDVLTYRDPTRYQDEKNQTTRVNQDGSTRVLEQDNVPTPVRGVHAMYQYPPENVSPKAWKHIHLPKRPIIHSPALTHRCPNPGDSMRCSSNDALSCRCASGYPLMPNHQRIKRR